MNAVPALLCNSKAGVPVVVELFAIKTGLATPPTVLEVVATGVATGRTSVPITRPRFVRAADALDAPVPPSATARSVIPATDPPVIATLPAACVAIVSRPRLLRAVDALPKSERLLARKLYAVSAPVAVTPRLVRAVAALARSDRLLAFANQSAAAAFASVSSARP